ncbi:MAG: pitrilysin family protein, partial [Acholeplasmataceae bacterium]|nr:pitrilysin family protein [Acholeplasmataceae bacterium]
QDNKRLYAQTKFYEHFFESDPYGYPLSGTLEDIKKLTLSKLNSYYKKVFLKNAVRIVVNGRISNLDIVKIESDLDLEREVKLNFETKFRAPREVKTIFEETDMNQAILKLGYHFPIFRSDKAYDAAVILDTILGGSPNSRLFQEIREKQGLCYDIHLSYDYYKGVIMISSGVDIDNKEKALESIQLLVEEMKKEGITEEELRQAKIYYQHQIKNSLDSQSVLTKRAFIRDLLGYEESIEERLAHIDQITVSDVNETLTKLTLDTIYVLFGGQS